MIAFMTASGYEICVRRGVSGCEAECTYDVDDECKRLWGIRRVR